MTPKNPVALLVADASTRMVFDAIVNDGMIRLKDLLERLPEANAQDQQHFESGMLRERIRPLLTELKKENLIQEHSAPIEDFNTYNATAAGLSAHRELRRLRWELEPWGAPWRRPWRRPW